MSLIVDGRKRFLACMDPTWLVSRTVMCNEETKTRLYLGKTWAIRIIFARIRYA